MASLTPPIAVALVTGANGFIGEILSARLQSLDVRVVGVMRKIRAGPWDRVVVVDLSKESPPAEAMANVDTVFHLAGKVHALEDLEHDDAHYYLTNVEGTRRLLDAAVTAGVARFIYFSSVKAMGEGGEQCLDESYAATPETPYGRSKLAAEQLVLEAGRTHRLHTTILRLPPVYGPGCKGNLPRMLRGVKHGRIPILPDTNNKRSMVHVADVVDAALLVARSPRASRRTYIVTDGLTYSTRQLYSHMCEAVGKKERAWRMPTSLLKILAAVGDSLGRARGRRFIFDSDALKKLTTSAWYTSAKIEEGLGFRPRNDLRSALPELVESLIETKDK